MQLTRTALAVVLALGLAAGAQAQSLAPMRKTGTTPSDIKGFRLTVGNPYAQRMHFEIIPMDPTFTHRAENAQVNPAELVLAPDYARQVILMFRIPEPSKERTIGLCIQPKNIAGTVLPRVCGTYHGRRLSSGSRGN